MLKVRITNTYPEWPLLRQTPGGRGVWDSCRFFLNEEIEECDYWVVYEGLLHEEHAACAPENTILITGEPPPVKAYHSEFLKQFGTVIACDRNIDHPNVIFSQQAMPWHVGRLVKGTQTFGFSKDYDELSSITSFDKTKLISVISSDKRMTAGHSQRFDFARRLEARLGEKIDVFGRGWRDIDDKWEAIAPYKYHVVIENSRYPDYWTEKLGDAYLGAAYPFYYGCSNLGDYFSPAAFTSIDIDDEETAIGAIESAITENQYEKSVSEIQTARDAVLNRYNLFPMICDYVARAASGQQKQNIVLRPESSFAGPDKPDKFGRARRLKSLFTNWRTRANAPQQ